MDRVLCAKCNVSWAGECWVCADDFAPEYPIYSHVASEVVSLSTTKTSLYDLRTNKTDLAISPSAQCATCGKTWRGPCWACMDVSHWDFSAQCAPGALPDTQAKTKVGEDNGTPGDDWFAEQIAWNEAHATYHVSSAKEGRARNPNNRKHQDFMRVSWMEYGEFSKMYRVGFETRTVGGSRMGRIRHPNYRKRFEFMRVSWAKYGYSSQTFCVAGMDEFPHSAKRLKTSTPPNTLRRLKIIDLTLDRSPNCPVSATARPGCIVKTESIGSEPYQPIAFSPHPKSPIITDAQDLLLFPEPSTYATQYLTGEERKITHSIISNQALHRLKIIDLTLDRSPNCPVSATARPDCIVKTESTGSEPYQPIAFSPQPKSPIITDTQDLLLFPEPSTYATQYLTGEERKITHSIISDQEYDAATSHRSWVECESIDDLDGTPHTVRASTTTDLGLRSITADSDEAWGIAGKKYGAVDLKKTLRSGRESRSASYHQSTATSSTRAQLEENPLEVARSITERVSSSIRNTTLSGLGSVVSVLAIAEFMLADPTLTPASVGTDHYLGMYLLIGGNYLDFRCHDGELYQCSDDLVYTCTKDPPVIQRKEAEVLSALEGLFIYAAKEEKEISAISLRRVIVEFSELTAGECTDESLLAVMHQALRKNWDYAKVSTKGRPYAAHEGAKLADIVSKARAQIQSDLRKGRDSCLWSTFSRRCESAMPPNGGVKFLDCYMNTDWEEEILTREKNCYSRLPYKFKITDADCHPGYTVKTQLEELDLFVDSAFYDNDPWMLCSLATMKLAMRGVPTEKMFYIVGPGGDSKGLVSTLEQSVMGVGNTSRLDPSIFGGEEEFRRSAHFAIGKKDILFSECRIGSRFVGDLWKRFVVSEPCDVRSNFGQTTQARFWGRKTQHCNYGDIPVIERYSGDTSDESSNYSNSVYRRILGFQAGKAKLVRDPSLVDPPNGVFLLKPQHTMIQFLEHPATSSLFFQEYLHPFCLEWSINDCLSLLQSPPPSVVTTTKWFARRLSGVWTNNAPPAAEDTAHGQAGMGEESKFRLDEHDEILVSLHEKWAHQAIIFNHKFAHEPTLDPSKKMRASSFRRLLSRDNSIGKHLFAPTIARNRQGGVENCFERIPLDFRRYELLFIDVSRFGSMRDSAKDDGRVALSNAFCFPDLNKVCSQDDPIVDKVHEILSLSSLARWADGNVDRRQDQLAHYIELVKERGKPMPGRQGVFTMEQEYRRKSGVGRSYCGWLSLQQCTRESRCAALECLPWQVYELDIVNCQPRLLLRRISEICSDYESRFPTLVKYCNNTDDWRSAIASYFSISREEAKKILLRMLFGGKCTYDGSPDIPPCLRRLQIELESAMADLSRDDAYSSILLSRQASGADRPMYSALSIYLGGMENECMQIMKAELVRSGFVIISLVYDGIYFAVPDEVSAFEEIHRVKLSVLGKCGMEVSLKNLHGSRIKDTQESAFDFWRALYTSISSLEGGDVKNPFASYRHMCIPVAIYNIDSGICADAIKSDGPMTYAAASSFFGVSICVTNLRECVSEDGKYLLHHSNHCAGICVQGEYSTICDLRRPKLLILPTSELWRNLRELSGYVLFKMMRGIHHGGCRDGDMELSAASDYDHLAEISPLWEVQKFHPLSQAGQAEKAFRDRLRREVQFVTKSLLVDKRKKPGERQSTWGCPICPFRTFSDKRKVAEHLKNQHIDGKDFTPTKACFRISQALHNSDLVKSTICNRPMRCNLLQRGAQLLRSWVGEVPPQCREEISNTSDICRFLTMLFSGERGPIYTLKCKMGKEYRLNEQVHFDADFANMVLMYALISQGRLILLRDQIATHYSRSGYECFDFLRKHSDFYQDILQCVMGFPEVGSLMEMAIAKSIRHQEWVTLSHDGTYKLAKSLIGEANHGSRGRDGPVKVIHTLRGMSGAAPGISIQVGETRDACIRSVREILPPDARAQCRFIYTDDVSNFISSAIGASRDELLNVFPMLMRVLYRNNSNG